MSHEVVITQQQLPRLAVGDKLLLTVHTPIRLFRVRRARQRDGYPPVDIQRLPNQSNTYHARVALVTTTKGDVPWIVLSVGGERVGRAARAFAQYLSPNTRGYTDVTLKKLLVKKKRK